MTVHYRVVETRDIALCGVGGATHLTDDAEAVTCGPCRAQLRADRIAGLAEKAAVQTTLLDPAECSTKVVDLAAYRARKAAG